MPFEVCSYGTKKNVRNIARKPRIAVLDKITKQVTATTGRTDESVPFSERIDKEYKVFGTFDLSFQIEWSDVPSFKPVSAARFTERTEKE
jgi:hypothetical protein